MSTYLERRKAEKQANSKAMKWFIHPKVGLLFAYLFFEFILTFYLKSIGATNALKIGSVGMVVLTILGMIFQTQYGLKLYRTVSFSKLFLQNLILFIVSAGIANLILYIIHYHTNWNPFEGITLQGYIYAAFVFIPASLIISLMMKLRS